MRSRRSLWLYPLFQVPLMCLIGCLIAALLFWLLGLGRPNVAVAIALDLSNSTYAPQTFNAPGTIMYEEIRAVESYLDRNSQLLRIPNQIQIFGFGGVVLPLTSGFETDSQKVKNELNRALQNPSLPQRVAPDSTNINLAIQAGNDALNVIQERCRELLLVTDGAAAIDPRVIADAIARKVRINAVVVGNEAPALLAAAIATHGIYLGQVNNLQELFAERFFVNFNTNIKWIIFWLGAAFISLMWMLILPLDRWIFQGLIKLEMPLAGRLAIGNALFWSVLIPILVWRLFGLPFVASC